MQWLDLALTSSELDQTHLNPVTRLRMATDIALGAEQLTSLGVPLGCLSPSACVVVPASPGPAQYSPSSGPALNSEAVTVTARLSAGVLLARALKAQDSAAAWSRAKAAVALQSVIAALVLPVSDRLLEMLPSAGAASPTKGAAGSAAVAALSRLLAACRAPAENCADWSPSHFVVALHDMTDVVSETDRWRIDRAKLYHLRVLGRGQVRAIFVRPPPGLAVHVYPESPRWWCRSSAAGIAPQQCRINSAVAVPQ